MSTKYNLISFCKTNIMDTEKMSKEISEELVRLWDEFELNEEFYECTEDGVEFDYLKCMQRRVVCLGSSILYSFESATRELYKIVLLDAFAKALLKIHTTAKHSQWIYEGDNINIHNAGISTLKDIAVQLKEDMD